MSINIKATNIELTDAINDYVNKKLDIIEKFVKDNDEMHSYVEVAKTTNHHKQGDVYRAEFDIKIGKDRHFSMAEKDDLYSAVDEVKDEIIKGITRNNDRRKTLFKRGAISVKKMLKGISKRNPFTSK